MTLPIPYIGLMEPELAPPTLSPDTIMVLGAQGSGNRLMQRILEAGGFLVYLDTSHGWHFRPSATRVIYMQRNPEDAIDSRNRNFTPGDQIPYSAAAAAASLYPNTITIQYEELCETPQAIINRIANWLNTTPWPAPEPIRRPR